MPKDNEPDFSLDSYSGISLIKARTGIEICMPAQLSALESEAQNALNNPEMNSLILDLSETSFMDSIGLDVMVSIHLRAKDLGKNFIVYANKDSQVSRLIEILGFDEHIEVAYNP